MSKKLIFLLTIFMLCSTLFSTTISFSGGESHLVLKEGREEVTLSLNAEVTSGTIKIKSEKIVLNGDDWRYVSCEGKTTITDEERGIEIRTNRLWYDREEEVLVISSWFEIDDKKEELYAEGGALRYSMKNEELELNMQIRMMKITSDGLMRCSSESVTYNRDKSTLYLRGSSHVDWKGDEYEAEVIEVDLDNDTITLGGRIKGVING